MVVTTKKLLTLQCLASLAVLSPLLFFPLASFVGNSDALFYAIVLKQLAHSMTQGDWLAHWLPQANDGHGSAVMLFYNPLAYYISAILGAPFAEFDPLGWKRLVFGMFIAQWAAGFTSYIWLARRFSPNVSLVASLLFTLFPYKFVYIFLHINLAQLWALVWLPLLMMSAEDLAAQKAKAIAWYGLWLSLLALTHLLTVIAFSGLPVLYALVFSTSRFRTLLHLALAHMLAIGIAAFYLLPAILNAPLVNTGMYTIGRFYYAQNLSHYDLLLNLHYAVIAALCLGLWLRSPSLHSTRFGKETWFYMIAFAAVVFLCLRLSKPIWDALPPFQLLQFPVARLHAVALIAITWLSALFLARGREINDTRWLYSPATLLLPIAVTSMMTLHHIATIYSQPNGITWPYIESVHQKNIILPHEYELRDTIAPQPPVFRGEKQSVALSFLSMFFTAFLLLGCKLIPASLRFRHDQNH